jgi:hypothetical protein
LKLLHHKELRNFVRAGYGRVRLRLLWNFLSIWVRIMLNGRLVTRDVAPLDSTTLLFSKSVKEKLEEIMITTEYLKPKLWTFRIKYRIRKQISVQSLPFSV